MNEEMSSLEVNELSAGYHSRPVLRGITLGIRPGENIALIGPNGCGKSTLFRVIAGLLPASKGEIRLCGNDLGSTSTDERVRWGIGHLAQTRNIFGSLTVDENLKLAAESISPMSYSNDKIQKVLGAFPDLTKFLATRAGLLSGGQRQSLAVAMVLVRPQKVLLLDEPVAGLSPVAGTALLQALGKIQGEEGFATVIIEHRLRQVQPHVNRVLVMREGRIVEDTADTAKILDASWLKKHYENYLLTHV